MWACAVGKVLPVGPWGILAAPQLFWSTDGGTFGARLVNCLVGLGGHWMFSWRGHLSLLFSNFLPNIRPASIPTSLQRTQVGIYWWHLCSVGLKAFFYFPFCYMEVFIALKLISTPSPHHDDMSGAWIGGKLPFSPVFPTWLVTRISRAPSQTFGFSMAWLGLGIRILTLSCLEDDLGITDLGHTG